MSIGKPKLNEEYPPADESTDIRKMTALVDALHHPQKDGRVLRAQHAKDTGCVKGLLIVEPNLSDEYRFGVFREPRTYPIIIRFSNASEFVESDAAGTPRGMAIKIPHVDGVRAIEGDGESSQDFLLVDSPAFIFSAVKDYTILFAIRRRLKFDPLALLVYFFRYPFQTLRIIKTISNKSKNSLIQRYWSMSPFRLGTRAVKLSAKPQDANSNIASVRGDENATDFLFPRLAESLRANEASFDFMVQFQEDPVLMPIEDASVEWEESKSPFRKVATIRLPAQDLESQEMRDFRKSCEDLSFNPWHCLADHRPLGGLNRLRRAAYEVSVLRRLQKPS
jgi:hypothetical protein